MELYSSLEVQHSKVLSRVRTACEERQSYRHGGIGAEKGDLR